MTYVSTLAQVYIPFALLDLSQTQVEPEGTVAVGTVLKKCEDRTKIFMH